MQKTFIIILSIVMQLSVATELLENPQIVDGVSTNIIKVPYQVSIRLRKYDTAPYTFGLGHFCGGSLIKSNIVLTAAHCLGINQTAPFIMRPAKDLVIVAGNTQRMEINDDTQIFNVTKLVAHCDFHFKFGFNDLALIYLDGHIRETTTVKLVEINTETWPPGTTCVVSGWGLMANSYSPNDLQSIKVRLLSYRNCKQFYHEVPESILCAVDLMRGAYVNKGDSGGPLVCHGLLVGIVSGARKTANHTGVYTNVNYYKDFIESGGSSCKMESQKNSKIKQRNDALQVSRATVKSDTHKKLNVTTKLVYLIYYFMLNFIWYYVID